MTFTLTLLGTDTQFTPGRTEKGYDKAETLSYVSTLISSESNPEKADETVQFKSQDVQVVNGPTTLGTEVGDRIARGVLAILEAISRGETNISIVAHSRGAVEAILVAHELERIQKLLAANQEADIQKSVCPYTATAMNSTPHKEQFSQLNIPALKDRIQGIKLSMFNIDPVPGGNYMVLTKPTYLAWKDPRFYQVPAIVNQYVQYSYLNERTRCFKGIVPKPVSPETEFTLESLPGHHGTGSGNLKDQQRRDLPENLRGKSVEHVQQLVLLKLVAFLRKNRVNLDLKRAQGGPFEDILGRLDRASGSDNEFDLALADLYGEQYELIMHNKEAYDHFNTTSYALLGKEQYFQGFLWKILDQRIVHYQSHNDTYLPSVVPVPPGGKFLNYEHARLYLNRRLGLSADMSLADNIRRSVDGLITICLHTQKLNKLNPEAQYQQMQGRVEATSLNTSVSEDKMAQAVRSNSKEGFALILEALSLLTEEVRKPFLLDTPSQQGVYEAVAESIQKLQAPELQDNELAKSILDKLNNDLEQTLCLKRSRLFSEYDQLRTYMKGNAFFDSMISTLDLTFKSLTQGHSGTDTDSFKLSERLVLILEQSKNIRNGSVLEKKKSIESHIKGLAELEEGFSSEKSKAVAMLVLNTMTEAIDESENYSIPEIMKELLQVNRKLGQYRNNLVDFRNLYSKLPYTEWDKEAEEKQSNLVLLAAEYIVREKLDLEKDIWPIFAENEELYQRIANSVYGLGVPHPLVFKLEEIQERLSQVSIQFNMEKEAHAQDVERLRNELSDFSRQLNEEKQRVKQLTEAHRIEIGKLQTKIDEMGQLVESLNAQIQSQKSQLSRQSEALTRQIELANELQTEKEVKAAHHILTQLVPITENYINHLRKEAKKLGPKVDVDSDEHIFGKNTDEAYQKIRNKYLLTQELLDTLINKDAIPLPSERISAFTRSLIVKDEALKEHRDSMWKQYAKNCLVGLAVACSGIIPGLLILLGYSRYNHKSSMVFFSKSAGGEYVERLQNAGIKLTP